MARRRKPEFKYLHTALVETVIIGRWQSWYPQAISGPDIAQRARAIMQRERRCLRWTIHGKLYRTQHMEWEGRQGDATDPSLTAQSVQSVRPVDCGLVARQPELVLGIA
eukprot:3721926-Rhodomonas_salina.1